MNYKQMTEYFKIQGYTDEQIKRALIFIDNQEYYQFTNQIIEEIVTNVDKTNENINEMTINSNQEIVKSLDPLEQLNKGYINLDYIHILSPTIYDSNKLRSVLSDAIVNIKSSDLESKIDTHTNTLNGLKEIVYVFDMIKNTIPPHKEKDKAFIDMISLNIKEGFPELKNQIPENFTNSKETIDFINSINKSSVFKNKENYVDLQKTLHNIKDDIYSFNGLANVIIDLDNLKNKYAIGSENENKGLYEIHEIVQVYAANELLKNSYNHIEKFQDIQESKNVLEKVENTQEQENKDNLIAKATIISYFLSKLGANENIKNLDLNNLNVQQVNELAKELKDRVVIEQNKLEEDRIKNGMVKESSLLSLTLIGLFSDDAFSKYISKEEFKEKKIIKEQELFRLEDTLKALNQQELLNNNFTKQKETHYLQASIYDKYQDTIAIERIYNSLNRWKESKLYDLNEKLIEKAKENPILANAIMCNYAFDDLDKKIEAFRNVNTTDKELNDLIDQYKLKMEDMYSRMEADKAKNGGKLTKEQEIKYAKEAIALEQPINERQKEILEEEKKEAEKNNLSEEEKKALKAKENSVTELNIHKNQLDGIINFVEKSLEKSVEKSVEENSLFPKS